MGFSRGSQQKTKLKHFTRRTKSNMLGLGCWFTGLMVIWFSGVLVSRLLGWLVSWLVGVFTIGGGGAGT